MQKRKEKARKLAEQEVFEEKKHRLTQALAQKLQTAKNDANRTETILSEKRTLFKVISSFLEENQHLVETTDLKQIGNLKSIALEYLNHFTSSSSENDKKCRFIPDPDPPLNPAVDGMAGGTKLVPKHSDSDEMITNPWQLIDKYKILQAKEEAEKSYNESEWRKKRMAMTLNEQIEERENAIRNCKEEYQQFVVAQEAAIRKWEEEKQNSILKQKQKADELKEVRQRQIQERVRLKEIQNARQKEQEGKEMVDIRNALMKEEENKEKSKMQERKKWEQIMKENAMKLQEKKKQKEEEERMDAKLMADMKEKMDKEEAKRIESIQKRSQKLEFNGQLLSETGAFNKRDEIRKFEQRLLKAAQDRERAQLEEEARRKEIMKNRINAIQETNKKMIEDKMRQKLIVEKEKEAFVAECLKDVEVVTKEEQMKISKERENKLRYREILKSQMDDRKQGRVKEDSMTPAEWSLNKKVLEDAKQFLKEHGSLEDGSEQSSHNE
mmetsp:Transcript_917/g.1596  ORF Transcript_917/g.1596 Transcript_917/m.1596 type:complete len:497 (+) Transcript_917:3724-5214(+)|eukprot:CAMPEP_0176500862 /NCGR_PEP_ID=MMETSP0200_2-20121128/13825_1 /TAXON_ID=947934 /ORGANISM="Chaetoceros sp., Strain GSL56" /LENGTH=496 /DNA_ID=CAMNT_0017899653 /DNA_START=3651 /DNA_END=5141 /DNA_ORIENTATION=+